MDVTAYEPLKVVAELMSPIILDRQMPLDGLLGALIIGDPEFRRSDRENRRWRRAVAKYGRRDSERYFAERGWMIPDTPAHFIPLAVWGHGQQHGFWVYCSSWAIPEAGIPQGVAYFNKRLSVRQMTEWIEPGRTRIHPGKGEFKSEHIPFLYSVTPTLTWYVCGMRADIEQLLSVAFSVAKKRARGFGNVRQWHVEPMQSDCSVFSPRGELMRPIPLKLLEAQNITGDFQHQFTAYRPPYWTGRYVDLCAVAGTRDAKAHDCP